MPDGALDNSFGGSGKVSMTVPGVFNPSITGICLQDDKIVAVGARVLGNAWFSVPNQPSFALARYLPDGSLDSTFGTAGFDVDNGLTEGDFTWNIVVSPSNKLLVAGMVSGSGLAYVRRFNQNGGRDPGFGTNGTVLLSNGGFGGALTVNAAGEIFTAGRDFENPAKQARLWKLSAAGSVLPDMSRVFPKAVPVGYPLDTSTSDVEYGNAIVLQPDGRPVLTIKRSSSFDVNRGNGFITGRATTSLTPDTTYNGTGITLEDIDPLVSRQHANSIAVQRDGKLVVAGQVGGKWVVVRYTAGGVLDSTFGTGGKVVLDLGASGSAYKVLLDAAGDIFVAGHASNGTDQDFVVVKLFGSIDPVPAMLVRSGSTATSPIIANGQTTAISYGTARVGGMTLAKTFRVENPGTAPLNLDFNNITVPAGFVFSIAASTPSIAAGGNGKVSVLMRTSTLGSFSGPVVIPTNDPANSIFTFPVTGQVVPNDPPVFSGFLATINQGEKAKISLSKLTSKVSDANGDLVMVTDFSTASLYGASISFDGLETLLYSPPAAFFGTDQFSVTFSDGEAEIVGIVSVQVNQDPAFNPKNAPKLEPLPGGLAVSFTGIPGKKYNIQRSADLANWTVIATVTASSTGKVTFTDPSPPQPSAFYRIAF